MSGSKSGGVPQHHPGYQSGFGNEFATEAHAGALPVGQNAPQKAPLGLYTEQLSGSPFTARAASQPPHLDIPHPAVGDASALPAHRQPHGASTPFNEVETTPSQLRWDPMPLPTEPTDWLDGLTTLAGNGDLTMHSGVRDPSVCGEQEHDRPLLLLGGWRVAVRAAAWRAKAAYRARNHRHRQRRDCGDSARHQVPRRVGRQAKRRGYVLENFGQPLRLPDLGPIGANGLANTRDFLTPVAAYDDRDGAKFEVVAKFLGNLWTTEFDHSPLDVVAWHGNYAPYKYDLNNFNCINSVSASTTPTPASTPC